MPIIRVSNKDYKVIKIRNLYLGEKEYEIGDVFFEGGDIISIRSVLNTIEGDFEIELVELEVIIDTYWGDIEQEVYTYLAAYKKEISDK